MLSIWTFQVAFWLFVVAEAIFFRVLSLQYKTFAKRTTLQPLKRLLFASVLILIIADLPLMLVYANIIWFHKDLLTFTYIAVITNASSRVIAAILFYLIYRYGD